MSVGLLSYLGIGVESQGGTASGSVTVTDYVPFLSETLAVTRADLPDTGIRAQWDEPRMYGGQQNVGGSVQMNYHPMLSGYFMHCAFDVETVAQGRAIGSGATFREHVFTTKQTQFQAGSGSDLPTLTVEMYRGPTMTTGTTNSSFIYYNVTASAIEFNLQAGGLLQCNVDLVGRDYGGKSKSAQSFVPPEAYTWNMASLAIGVGGGASNLNATTVFQGLTIRMENNIIPIPKLDGRLRADLLKRGDFRRVMVNGTLTFQSFSEWDRFTGGSEAQFYLTLAGSNANNVHNWTTIFDIPRVRYSTLPVNVSGPGPLSVSFTGRGMIDPTSSYALEITQVNTRLSAYLVNTNG